MRALLATTLVLLTCGLSTYLGERRGLAVGDAGGYSRALARTGDYMVMRTPKGECRAFDPNTALTSQPYSPAADGRCHLSDYLTAHLGER